MERNPIHSPFIPRFSPVIPYVATGAKFHPHHKKNECRSQLGEDLLMWRECRSTTAFRTWPPPSNGPAKYFV